MAILKFRVYWEDDESTYRDICIRHTQTFYDLHLAILKSFDFDNKHKATFYRSNDNWQKGREISLEKYEKPYRVDPLIMAEISIGSEVKNPNQKFVYEYDFNKNWHFMLELINVEKDENVKMIYPACVRSEGLAPSQYGTKGLVDSRLAEMEEKYDLRPEALNDGFGEEGADDSLAEGSGEESASEDTGEDF